MNATIQAVDPPIWHGYTADIKAQFVDWAEKKISTSTEARLEEIRGDIETYKTYAASAMELVKKHRTKRNSTEFGASESFAAYSARRDLEYYQQRVSELQCQETALNRAVTYSAADLEQQFDYFAALNCVVGIRFKDDDTFVVLVRIVSHEFKTPRDLGDYEIRLACEDYGLHHKVKLVRNPVIDRTILNDEDYEGLPLYYEEDVSGDDTWSHYCFGARDDEIDRMLEVGNFAGFFSLAINSMTQINPGHQEEWKKQYPKISDKDSWVGCSHHLASED